MHQDYRIGLIRELRDQQVRFAPRTRRLEQAERAERLLADLDLEREYPYEFIYFRVTDFRPDESARKMVRGEDAAHDLRNGVEEGADGGVGRSGCGDRSRRADTGRPGSVAEA